MNCCAGFVLTDPSHTFGMTDVILFFVLSIFSLRPLRLCESYLLQQALNDLYGLVEGHDLGIGFGAELQFYTVLFQGSLADG